MTKITIRIYLIVILALSLITTISFADGEDPVVEVEVETESGKSFTDLIMQFKQDGVIPDSDGQIIELGDYVDSLANLGMFKGIPLMESDHFVITANINWESSHITPNSTTSGCGILFNMNEENGNYLLASIRMDGRIYLSGYRNFSVTNYGNYFFTNPSIVGGGKLTLVWDDGNAEVWLNGQKYISRQDLPSEGSAAGLAILSGTNFDFGTRCNFSDISIYQWE